MTKVASPTMHQPGITPYTCYERGQAAALSLSATANVAVTEWRNADGYKFFPVKHVKTLAIEFLYAGIFAAGTLEFVARAVCAIPVVGFALLADRCLKDCLPECVWSVLRPLVYHTVTGALVSGATAADALIALKDNVFGNAVKMSYTHSRVEEESKSKYLAVKQHPLYWMSGPKFLDLSDIK
jgi:hypothetical protein